MSAITCLIGKASKGLVDLAEAEKIKYVYEKHYEQLAEQVAGGKIESTSAAKTLGELMRSQEGLSDALKSKLSNWGAHKLTAEKTLAVLNAQAGSKINKMVTTAKARETLVSHFGTHEEQLAKLANQKINDSVKHVMAQNASQYGLDKVLKTNTTRIWSYHQESHELARGTHALLLSPIKNHLESIKPNEFGVYDHSVYTLESDFLKAKYGQKVSDLAQGIHDSFIDSIRAGNNLLREVGFPIVDPKDARVPLLYDPRLIKKNPALFRELIDRVDMEYLHKQVPETIGFTTKDISEALLSQANNQNLHFETGKRFPLELVKRFLTLNDQSAEQAFNQAFKESKLFEDMINFNHRTVSEYTARTRYGTDFEGVAREIFVNKTDSDAFSRFPKYMTGQFADYDPGILAITINSYGKPITAASQLGGTPLQALVGDPINAAFSAALSWSGVNDASFAHTGLIATKEAMSTFMRSFGSGFQSKKMLQAEASKILTLNEVFNDLIISESRHIEGIMPSKFGGLLYNSFNVISLLKSITQKRQAFAVLETGMHLADYVGKRFESLPTGAQNGLRNLGMTSEMWSRINDSHVVPVRHSKALSAVELYNQGEDQIARILAGFIALEKERFVPTSGAVSSAVVAQWSKNAPKLGKAAAAAGLQYSGWTFSTFFNTVVRMANLFDGTFQGAGKALGGLTSFYLALVTMDGVYRQMMNLANGKDPDNMDESFWGKSALRALPIPLLSNIVQNFFSTNGNSMLGPVGSIAQDIYKAIDKGESKGLKQGLMTGFDAASHYVPGNNIWYAVGAYRNLVIPTLKKFIFGKEGQAAVAKQYQNEKNRGTTRFFTPDKGFIRAPNLEKAFESPKKKPKRR